MNIDNVTLKNLKILNEAGDEALIRCDLAGNTQQLWVKQEWLEEKSEHYVPKVNRSRSDSYPSHYIP